MNEFLQVSTMAKVSVETRDNSIQILDRFIAQLDASVLDDPLKDNSAFFIGLAAAAAIILSSKIHEIRPLCVSNFPHFEKDQLLEFERRLLLMIGFQITPQTTPSACTRLMLRLWPEVPHGCATPTRASNENILITTDLLIGQFWKDMESLHYAPSTIALSALLLTFSKYKMDCSAWLQRLPDECFPPKAGSGTEHAVFANDELSFLNIDLCLSAMQKVQLRTNLVDRGAGVSAGCTGNGGRATSAMEEEEASVGDKRRRTPTTTAELADDML